MSGQRLGNGFFTFFDAYLQVIIYKFHSIVNIKFLYKVCNFSNKCKSPFFAGKFCLGDLFCTDRKPIISGFFKTFSHIFIFTKVKFSTFARKSRNITFLLHGEIEILEDLWGLKREEICNILCMQAGRTGWFEMLKSRCCD